MELSSARAVCAGLAVLVLVVWGAGGRADHAPAGWQDVRAAEVCLRIPALWYDLTAEASEALDEEGLTVLGFWSSVDIEDDDHDHATYVLVMVLSEEFLAELIDELEADEDAMSVAPSDDAFAGQRAVWKRYCDQDLHVGENVGSCMWLAYRTKPDTNGQYLMAIGVEPSNLPLSDSVVHPILVSAATCADAEPVSCSITVRPGESIQEAIDEVEAGAVICLAEGEWVERLTIDKALTLRAEQDGLSSIQGDEEGVPVILVHSPGEEESVVRLVGLSLTGSSGWGSDGVRVTGNAQVTIERSTIEGSWCGVFGWASANILVVNTIVKGNDYGVWVRDSARVLVDNSVVEGNRWDGILARDSAYLSVEQSQIVGNGRYGVVLLESPCFGVEGAFSGYVSGFGNTISELADEEGAPAPGVCPVELVFLLEEDGGELDRRQ